jgi:hypothetical protein
VGSDVVLGPGVLVLGDELGVELEPAMLEEVVALTVVAEAPGRGLL